MLDLEMVSERLAQAAFRVGAIRVRPDEPFAWASGWKSPIYNDNRIFLFHPDLREIVTDGLMGLVRSHYPLMRRSLIHDSENAIVIAGTSSAGIPPAAFLAHSLAIPLIYVRDKPKVHGLRNRIEGIDSSRSLDGSTVVLIEDLISTGRSSVSAVQAIRDAGGTVNHCFSIFNYGFPKAKSMFAGKEPFEESTGRKLAKPCLTESILGYDQLLRIGVEKKYFSKSTQEILAAWRQDPEKWSNDWKEKSEKV